MKKSSRVKVGVIGLGGMGQLHADDIRGIEKTELAAVCDTNRGHADRLGTQFGVPAYDNHHAMLESVDLDAVLVATPHYDHPQISIDAFDRGVNVLTEKPIAVHTKAGGEMIAAYEASRSAHPGLVFAEMFQQRTYGHWQKIKSMIDSGDLGKLLRATWVITDWFRTQIYYDNGGWRATWKGEGGGVLLNQCPHNLDLFQWFFGMPSRVTGFAAVGKYHNIEVEDEVTGYMEYEDGMIGHFITSTAESPGTNRLEIVGENGKLIFEDDRLTFFKNRISMFDQIRQAVRGFEKVNHDVIEVQYNHHGQPGHRYVIENFAEAILEDAPLIAPGVEGLNSLQLGNAIIFSSMLGETLQLPIDAEAYAVKLQELGKNSNFQKVVRSVKGTDMRDSF